MAVSAALDADTFSVHVCQASGKVVVDLGLNARLYLTTPDAACLANEILEAMYDDWSRLMGMGS
ncbi:hypothetical protein ACFWF3_06450 [Nocardia sp. NPDC060220]|uniref:hypothetical protein n=1 Tax=Nocardia sp. NPDC060220 TaxID=3347076 RepID=UPI00365F31AF